ncbi:hypothetical protein BQ8482_360140 [Mesorhizobium delmotii]|uniref:Uncharacterized protein n=1 Tax=Mesorhizobium delmotii TaxID=1631247 RepID=A0A2P9ARG6_9HYPH|nr:hypothetical protein BQ8482_360140 [Mesorhizobium delmotii]
MDRRATSSSCSSRRPALQEWAGRICCRPPRRWKRILRSPPKARSMPIVRTISAANNTNLFRGPMDEPKGVSRVLTPLSKSPFFVSMINTKLMPERLHLTLLEASLILIAKFHDTKR